MAINGQFIIYYPTGYSSFLLFFFRNVSSPRGKKRGAFHLKPKQNHDGKLVVLYKNTVNTGINMCDFYSSLYYPRNPRRDLTNFSPNPSISEKTSFSFSFIAKLGKKLLTARQLAKGIGRNKPRSKCISPRDLKFLIPSQEYP